MATSDNPDETAQDTQATDKLTRFANVIGGVFFGLLVTGAALMFLASGLQMAGGGVWYALMFIVATGFGYRAAKQLTEDYPAIRLPIVVVGLGAIALACASWRSLGFEDPFVAPAIFAIFLMLGYFFTGGSAAPVKSWKDEMEERLAVADFASEAPSNSPEAREVMHDTPAMDAAPGVSEAVHASVTFYRMSKMIGMEVVYYISCDGEPVARVADGSRVTVSVPAGNHQFALTDEYGTAPLPPIDLTLARGEEIYVDCTFRSFWSGVTFKTVPAAEAEQDMEGLITAT